MWGGIHFFISIDVLVSFAAGVDGDAVKEKPGKPVRKVTRNDEGAPLIATSYPCGSLLLSTLKATGNQVHIFGPWDNTVLEKFVAMFGWRGLVTDIRSLHTSPGCTRLSLASLGCDPTWYANTVVLVSTPADWELSMVPLLIHVNHGESGADIAEAEGTVEVHSATNPTGTQEAVQAVRSMELLHALCRCVTLAEWRVRVPGTPVAASLALSTVNVFSCCRIFVPSALSTTRMALLLSTHGATITSNEMEATHILYMAPSDMVVLDDGDGAHEREDEPDGATSSSSSSSVVSSSASSLTTNTDTDSSSDTANSDAESDGAEEGENEEKAKDTVSENTKAIGPDPKGIGVSTVATTSRNQAQGKQREAEGGSTVPTTVAPIHNSPPLDLPTTLNARALLVTRRWVERCCRALRLLPVPAPSDIIEVGRRNSSELDRASVGRVERLRTTGALLSAILPPVDAKPLPFPQFQQICMAYHFSTLDMEGDTAAGTLTLLASIFRGVALVRQLQVPAPSPNTEKGSRVAPKLTEQVSDPTIFLCRHERRRDRDAVSEHLKLQASQFAFSFDAVTKERRFNGCRDAISQTAGPRYAHAAVGTEDMVTNATENTPTTTASAVAVVTTADDAGKVAADAKKVIQKDTVVVEVSDDEETCVKKEVSPPAADVEVGLAQKNPTSPMAKGERADSDVAAEEEAETPGAVNEEEWKNHLKNVEGKVLLAHEKVGSVGQETVTIVEGGRQSGPETHGMTSSSASIPPGASVSHEPSIFSAPPPLTPASQYGHHALPPKYMHPGQLSPSVPPEQLPAQHTFSSPSSAATESIFPMPALNPRVEDPFSGATTAAGTSLFNPLPQDGHETRECSINVEALSNTQQRDFFQYLQLMPMFSGYSSSARVVEDFSLNRVRCVFTTSKEAIDFAKLLFIDFGGMEHPISLLPVGESPLPRPSHLPPQRDLQPPHHPHTHHQQQPPPVYEWNAMAAADRPQPPPYPFSPPSLSSMRQFQLVVPSTTAVPVQAVVAAAPASPTADDLASSGKIASAPAPPSSTKTTKEPALQNREGNVNSGGRTEVRESGRKPAAVQLEKEGEEDGAELNMSRKRSRRRSPSPIEGERESHGNQPRSRRRDPSSQEEKEKRSRRSTWSGNRGKR